MLDYLILGLATWRISSILVVEDGPWNMFPRFRYFIGVRFDEHNEAQGENMIARAFTCVWCISVWVGAVLVFFTNIQSDFTLLLSLPFALSAVAILIERYVND